MKDEELEKALDRVYAVGFKNGQIAMKNKILKAINRDWTFAAPITIKILKKIQSLRLIVNPKKIGL